MSLLGDRIKRAREERGLGQDELAADLGVRQQSVSRWENGVALPRPARLRDLACVLDLEVAQLQRLAGYLPEHEQPWGDDEPRDALHERVLQLPDADLLLLVELASQELHRRRAGGGPGPG